MNRIFYSLLVPVLILSCVSRNEEKPIDLTGNAPEVDTARDIAAIDTASIISIPAINLTQDFLENEVSAENKYKGQKLSVNGVIEDIKRGYASGSVFISLKGCERFTSVQCFLTDEKTVDRLKRGENVKISGYCSGLNVNVILDKCKLEINKSDCK